MATVAFTKAVPVTINGKDSGLTALYHEVQHIGIDPINGWVNVNIQSYATKQAREAGVAPYNMFSRQYNAQQIDVNTVLNPGDKGVIGVLADYIIANDDVLKDAQIA